MALVKETRPSAKKLRNFIAMDGCMLEERIQASKQVETAEKRTVVRNIEGKIEAKFGVLKER
mgnify:CR=1 FL=1